MGLRWGLPRICSRRPAIDSCGPSMVSVLLSAILLMTVVDEDSWSPCAAFIWTADRSQQTGQVQTSKEADNDLKEEKDLDATRTSSTREIYE